MAAFVGPAAFAGSGLITFTTSASGTRTMASTPPVFPDVNLTSTSGTIATTQTGGSAATTTVTEVFKGGNAWSVAARVCGPNSLSTPTTEDCTTYPDQIVRTDGTANIPGSQMAVTQTTPTVLGVPAGTASKGTDTDMHTSITTMTSSNEVSSTTYNGIYSNSTNLSIANLYQTGTWTGYWVTTLTG